MKRLSTDIARPSPFLVNSLDAIPQQAETREQAILFPHVSRELLVEDR
jgi:hypothetical protein